MTQYQSDKKEPLHGKKQGLRKKGRGVIQVNEGELKKHVSEIVWESVEEILNGLLEAEADQLCQARRYERNADRAR